MPTLCVDDYSEIKSTSQRDSVCSNKTANYKPILKASMAAPTQASNNTAYNNHSTFRSKIDFV